MFQIIGIGLCDSIIEAGMRFPAQRIQLAHIQQLAHRAIRFGSVKNKLAGEPHYLPDQFGQFTDAQVFPATHVHQRRLCAAEQPLQFCLRLLQ